MSLTVHIRRNDLNFSARPSNTGKPTQILFERTGLVLCIGSANRSVRIRISFDVANVLGDGDLQVVCSIDDRATILASELSSRIRLSFGDREILSDGQPIVLHPRFYASVFITGPPQVVEKISASIEDSGSDISNARPQQSGSSRRSLSVFEKYLNRGFTNLAENDEEDARASAAITSSYGANMARHQGSMAPLPAGPPIYATGEVTNLIAGRRVQRG